MFSSGDGVIVLGDSTTHGGKVVSAQSNYLLEGKPVAVVGDMVTCPKDGHSTCSIIEGHPTISLNGKPVAFHGCHTGCGAALISAASGKHGLG
ncbi:PAAR domain-containing protein [Cobetia marina]|uniref:PAAR domain-containing protein n=1 Tax=Cobetia marina TaxID=28258 RepID=UPI002547E88C|nr:PAAR domain-containing protein [Cobetia pacifica]MDI6002360.1 PAAR domain-containing protein [Cobetia pacifica]